MFNDEKRQRAVESLGVLDTPPDARVDRVRRLALELFDGPRWEALAAKGARPQRCLWASTSTKNPTYRDVLYSEELIGRDTVNTMPLSSVEAFADHGIVRGQTVLESVDRARRLWSDLIRVGIDEEEVGEQLETEGVDKFAASYQAMLDTIEAKRAEASG